MNFFNKLRQEFIDIIEWLDNSNDSILWRFPRYDNEIKNGAKLVVRPSQVAVFVNEGQVADVFQPGTHTLSTQNLPILGKLKGWKYGFESPFKAEVYFVNTKQFTDQKWGTKNPIMKRDPEFGPVRLRAFGTYAFRASDPVKLIQEISGTNGVFTIDGINDQLRNLIVTHFADHTGESQIPVLDMAANYNEFGQSVTEKMKNDFAEYGLEVTKILIENISLPEAVEKALDKRSSMGVIGDLNSYTKFQAAEALEDAAKNPGGGGLAATGAGLGLGMQITNQMQQANQATTGMQTQNVQTPPPILQAVTYFVAKNGQKTGPFDLNTLKTQIANNQVNPETMIWKQGMANWQKASEVSDLQNLFAQTPPPIPQS